MKLILLLMFTLAVEGKGIHDKILPKSWSDGAGGLNVGLLGWDGERAYYKAEEMDTAGRFKGAVNYYEQSVKRPKGFLVSSVPKDLKPGKYVEQALQLKVAWLDPLQAARIDKIIEKREEWFSSENKEGIPDPLNDFKEVLRVRLELRWTKEQNGKSIWREDISLNFTRTEGGSMKYEEPNLGEARLSPSGKVLSLQIIYSKEEGASQYHLVEVRRPRPS